MVDFSFTLGWRYSSLVAFGFGPNNIIFEDDPGRGVRVDSHCQKIARKKEKGNVTMTGCGACDESVMARESKSLRERGTGSQRHLGNYKVSNHHETNDSRDDLRRD